MYLCGIGPGIGIPPRDPHIKCDGCGLERHLSKRRMPPSWFLSGKAAPGWKLTRDGEQRFDYCPRCKVSR